MEVGGLQRSEISFRRSGSSGLIWDDKILTGDLNQMKKEEKEEKPEFRELRPSRSVGSSSNSRTTINQQQHSPSANNNGGGAGRPYRTMKVSSPDFDPPSPKVSGCGLCAGVFGKQVDQTPSKTKPGKRRP